MEFLFEVILELFFETSLEISKNKKISKWIRYPLIAGITFTFISVFGLITYLGVRYWQENKIASIFFILIAFILFIGCIIKFKKVYLKRENLKNKKENRNIVRKRNK